MQLEVPVRESHVCDISDFSMTERGFNASVIWIALIQLSYLLNKLNELNFISSHLFVILFLEFYGYIRV